MAAPITCAREDCEDTDGPFVRHPEGWVCEDCLDKEEDQ